MITCECPFCRYFQVKYANSSSGLHISTSPELNLHKLMESIQLNAKPLLEFKFLSLE